MTRKESDFAKFIREHPMPNFRDIELTDEEIDERFGLNMSPEENRRQYNKSMRDLYKQMKSPEGWHIQLNYPGGPEQFYRDVERGKFDD